MTDLFSKTKRSWIMGQVKSKNTTPELIIRKDVRQFGLKYKLHNDKLPGKPDISIASTKRALFINGCFWHGHNCKRGKRLPKSNEIYWHQKIAKNTIRDKLNLKLLKKMGWEPLVIWECQIKNREKTKNKIKAFLER